MVIIGVAMLMFIYSPDKGTYNTILTKSHDPPSNLAGCINRCCIPNRVLQHLRNVLAILLALAVDDALLGSDLHCTYGWFREGQYPACLYVP